MTRRKTERDDGGLSAFDRRFAKEFLVDLKMAAAYQRASLPKKVAYKTASTNAWKLMQRPEVEALVKQIRDESVERAGLGIDDALNKLRQLLMYDVRKLFHSDGKPKSVHELDDDTAMAVVGIDVVTSGNAETGIGEVRKYKLADRVAALDKAMRYHNLFEKEHKALADAITGVTVKLIKASRGD